MSDDGTTSHLFSADGRDDLSPTEGWGSVPELDRPAWARYMLDFCPRFLGVTMMLRITPRIFAGVPAAPASWKKLARSLCALGFTPVDYYLLCQDLQHRRAEGSLTESEHGQLFDQWREDGPSFLVPKPEAWATWVLHVRAGRSPRRATDYVLSEGSPAPIGRTSGGTPIGD